jgi:hypothetical protein
MVYDTLSKSLLQKADKANRDITGDDSLLDKAIVGAEVMATFEVWEIEGSDGVMRSGNWIRSVSSAAKQIEEEDKAIIKQSKTQIDPDLDFNDSLPF